MKPRLLGLFFSLWLILGVACTATLTETLPSERTPAPIFGSGFGTAEVATILPENLRTTTTTPFPAEGRIPTPAPPPTFTPIPTFPGGLSPTELKYRLLERFPDFFFCDPDLYPVARGDELERARARFAEMQANAEIFQSILRHHGWEGLTEFSDTQKLLIYRDYKRLLALDLEVDGETYLFHLLTGTDPGMQGLAIRGRIDRQGNIQIESQQPAGLICPICLAGGSEIETPHGPVAVEHLCVGDLVWTLDEHGQRLAAPLLAVSRVPAPPGHQMVHLRLSDGRELWASPGHPTADGRGLATLHPGDLLDGAWVVRLELVAYAQPFTYDLLPAGRGLYWANGILLQSTLKP